MPAAMSYATLDGATDLGVGEARGLRRWSPDCPVGAETPGG